jgi:two-component system nitrate/nitrite response regulator NarL
MRIVTCDDHRLLLEALSTALAMHGYTVVAATSTPADAVKAVRTHDPDMLLLDLSFPEGNGLDAARELLSEQRCTKIVVLTADDDPVTMQEAFDAGVAGYVRKDQRIENIVAALEHVAQGERVVDDALSRRLDRHMGTTAQSRLPVRAELTPREREVLRLLGSGLSTNDIVHAMGITSSTVRGHVQAIFCKLSVHSRLEAVAVPSQPNISRVGLGRVAG